MKKARLSVLSCLLLLIAVQPVMAQQPMAPRSDLGTIQAQTVLDWFKSLRRPTRADVTRAQAFLKSKYRCLRHGEGCSKKERALLGALAAAVAVGVGILGKKGVRSLALHLLKDYALFLAILREDFEMMQNALNAGADVNVRNEQGNTPLIVAAARGYKTAVEELLSRGARVNEISIVPGFGAITALIAAAAGKANPETAEKDFASIVTLLLDAGASINQKGPKDTTPLLLASESGDIDTIGVLLDAGAAIEARNEEEVTPYIMAIIMGHDEVAQLLTLRGADTRAKDIRGLTGQELLDNIL